MSSQAMDNKDIVRQYLNAFNEQNRDTLMEILADDVVEHGVHGEHHGPEEVIDLHESHFETFPDYTGSTEMMIGEDDKVVVRYTASGKHTEKFENVEPTGQEVEWSGIVIYRIEDDKIAEIWIEENRLSLLEQLEAVDPPAHLRI